MDVTSDDIGAGIGRFSILAPGPTAPAMRA